MSDTAKIRGIWTIRKFNDDSHLELWRQKWANPYEQTYVDPYEEITFENLLLLKGINELWRLFVGASTNTFTQPNSQIGVGDSATAAVNTQTDLLATTNKTYVTLDSGTGLTVGSSGGTNNLLVAQATFGSSAANYAWNEMCLKHSVSGIALNRGVQSLGTKASGTSWLAQLQLTLT